MVTIPAGHFLMGSAAEDKFASACDKTPRRCELSAFQMSRHPIPEPGSDLPWVNVSWEEAQAYCDYLGQGYRLPTEMEWEYACRAGSTTAFPTGDEPDRAQVNYLYDEQGNRVGVGKRLPNGWGKPNAFGLHDMLGNVCEWVADSWHSDSGATAVDSDLKVIRGGAWDYMPRLLRSSWRDFANCTTRRDNLGFRLCRDLA